MITGSLDGGPLCNVRQPLLDGTRSPNAIAGPRGPLPLKLIPGVLRVKDAGRLLGACA